jgi:fibronectin type 3 domain-containing protein
VKPHTRLVLTLLLTAGALVACGKQGPPVAPELRLPAGPTGLHGAVDEQTIVVSWTGPATRVDGSRLRTVALYKLYRREEANGGPPKSAMLSGGHIVGYDEIALVRMEAPAPAVVQGQSITWVDQRALSLGRRYVYVVTAEDAIGRSSAPSDRLIVPFLAAPRPPAAVRAEPGDRRVTLSWDAPTQLSDGSPAPSGLRYVVLRGGAGAALAPITPRPIDATTFTDTGVSNDTDYQYAVRAVRVDSEVSATGPASAAVAAAPAKTTPPTTPTGLVAVPSPGAIRLAWNPIPDRDVATYVVYRASDTGELVRIATTPPVGTVYTDRNVQPGTTYRYVVTAVDNARRPNESARSNEVSVRAQ